MTQLESKSSKTNSYNWLINFESSSIVEVNFETFFYVLKRILNKRVFRDQTYYLIKWKDYDIEHNVWYSVKALNDVEEFIVEYEARTRRRISQSWRVWMFDHRKTFNEATFIITNFAIEASFSQSISYQSEIEVRILRRSTFKSTISIKRETKFSRQ